MRSSWQIEVLELKKTILCPSPLVSRGPAPRDRLQQSPTQSLAEARTETDPRSAQRYLSASESDPATSPTRKKSALPRLAAYYSCHHRKPGSRFPWRALWITSGKSFSFRKVNRVLLRQLWGQYWFDTSEPDPGNTRHGALSCNPAHAKIECLRYSDMQ